MGTCALAIKKVCELPMREEVRSSVLRLRHYLHGDYLETLDRRPDSIVYCAFCDGNCLPAHLYEEHDLDASLVRLSASRKAFYRSQQRVPRPVDAANYFDGTPDPG